MSQAAALRYTYQDYLQLPEGERYEVIDGDLFMTPAPTTYHQRIIGRLFRFLDDHVRNGGLGEVLFAPCDVLLSETDVVQPDIFTVAKDRLAIIRENYVSGAPDLVVEVLSKGSAMRDRTLKKERYVRFGVRELWIVDPAAKTIEVLRSAGAGFERHALVGSGEVLASPEFSGLRIPLSEVF